MTRRNTWLTALMAIGLTMVLISCGAERTTPLDYTKKVNGIDLSGENWKLSDWGLTEQQVIEERGQPRRRSVVKDGTVILDYADYQYSLLGGHVQGYTLMPQQPTAGGVKVGDAKSRVIEKYGKDYYTREQNNYQILGYLDKENELALEFVLDSGRVTVILVSEFAMFQPS
ncbi:hypothetical protein [Paenibacillus kobensis]|uniref:hypothetical protein n=1 Tax=Paenibacillus kobensis TaxID=59841 RepID=UPI000FD955A9|nr:hypothetical protein [Paenibacillus kobensis]